MTGLTGLAMAAMLAAAPGPAASSQPQAGDCIGELAGIYAAQHMEMGGALLLGPDGRFRYELAYGALDEEARGRWTCDADTVRLTSDAVTPPRFEVLGSGPAPAGHVRVLLDLPRGMSRQYFSLLVHRADGSEERRQFDDEGLDLAFTAATRPVALLPVLPVYEVAGTRIGVPAGDGVEIRLRFAINDLGKVAFAGTALKREQAGLVLARFGEAIRFERTSPRRDEPPDGHGVTIRVGPG